MAENNEIKENKLKRRDQILEHLVKMLEQQDGSQKITTARLAQEVGVSEAALYRHFPSKNKMFDGLVTFIEETLFSRINLIMQEETESYNQLQQMIKLLLVFSERNPGLTRLLTGYSMPFETEVLQNRVNQLHARIELQFKQIFRERKIKEQKHTKIDEGQLASMLATQIEGRYLRYVRSGFKQKPMDGVNEFWQLIEAQLI